MNRPVIRFSSGDVIDCEAWIKAVQRAIQLDMQLKGLPPHVLKENRISYKPNYLAEYLQQQRMQMYKEDISKGLIKGVW
jgi:hypothetical protein